MSNPALVHAMKPGGRFDAADEGKAREIFFSENPV
jgi:hypothetical protein